MKIISTNITSPLGDDTESNYRAVQQGLSALKRYDGGERGMPLPFCASMFEEQPEFHQLALRSARAALKDAGLIDLQRTVFILSSTKGDLSVPLGESASRIASALGITNRPIAVCNACISGAAALILAHRLLLSGEYDYAVITGADVLTDFIIAGFHSLRALSPEQCRPFDIERLGLNLGEAAATMVCCADGITTDGITADCLGILTDGAIRNDAYHITNPHPQGEGAYRAISAVDKSGVGVVSVHGTATMYNDQMESKAICRAGLAEVPLSALKGYYGHTMGAAGLLESILTLRALHDGVILPSRGFSEIGVSGSVNISGEPMHTDLPCMLKIISGFGGCNAALRIELVHSFARSASINAQCIVLRRAQARMHSFARSNEHKFTPIASVTLDSKDNLTSLYKEVVGGDYPRFHKMDTLSRLAFIAVELLLRQCGEELTPDKLADHCSVMFFNRTSSCVSDRKFSASLCNKEEFYPSPAAFVYTLPNICMGEIALRHGIHGETSFFILPQRNEQQIEQIMRTQALDSDTEYIIGGWIDCSSEQTFECSLKVYKIMKNTKNL